MTTASLVDFKPVTDRFTEIAVICSGQSIAGHELNFGANVYVIAVNGGARLYPTFDAWFTLDPSPLNRTYMARAKNESYRRYYAAVPEDYGRHDCRVGSMRGGPEPRVHYLHRVTGTGHGRFRTKGGLPTDPSVIHTGNSGWGAFQLACHMQPRKIALFGVDGFGLYAYGGKPRALSPMPALFASAMTQLRERNIEVVNASEKSWVQCFDKKPVQEAVTWLSRFS